MLSQISSPLVSQKIFLTIGIPTYNQPEQLKRLLNSLVGQELEGVEIVIRDDSEGAESENIVKRYLRQLPIRYFRGPKIGIDGADFFLVEEARGEYVWWFGDDELSGGAISHVMFILQNNPEINFIWINSTGQEHDEKAIYLGQTRPLEKNEMLAELADLLGFLSALLFRRSIALQSLPYAEKYRGTNFGGLYPPLYVIAKSKSGETWYIDEPLIIADNKSPHVPLFYDSFQVFAVTFYEIVKEFSNDFKRHSLRKALARNFSSVWRTILVYRAKGINLGMGSPSRKFPTLFRLYWTFPEFWIAAPALLMPRFIVKRLYSIYKFFVPTTRQRFKYKN